MSASSAARTPVRPRGARTKTVLAYTAAVLITIFMLLPLLGSIWALLRADEHALASLRGFPAVAGCGLLGAVALLMQPMGKTLTGQRLFAWETMYSVTL